MLDNVGGILYALTYLVMFAIPLIAPREKPSWGLRWAAVSGFLMTLLYVVLSVVPIVEVPDRWLLSACFARTRACPHLCMTLPEW